MKRLILTVLLIGTANTVAATSLSIKHNKDLPSPYQLLVKGKMLERVENKQAGGYKYWIAWERTYDLYVCVIGIKAVSCSLLEQSTFKGN